MELRQLEHFLAVVDHEGLGRAAEHLFLSQPSLSQSVRALERELQVTLFHRTGRRLAPTPTGLLLVPLARKVLEDVVALRDATHRAREVEEGALEIACTPEMSSEAVAAWASGFTRAHPKVRLDISEVDSLADLVEAISGGRAELGFSVRPPAQSDVTFLRLGVQRLLLVRPPGSSAPTTQETVPLSKIGDLPLVTRQIASRENDAVQRTLSEHGVDLLVGASVPSRAAQLTFVLRSGLQAFLPLRMAVAALDAGAVVVETIPTIETEFGIIHRNGALAPAAEQFVKDVREALDAWFAAVDNKRAAGLGLVAAVAAAHASA